MADSHGTSTQQWIKEVESELSDLTPGERAAVIVELDAQIKRHSGATYDRLNQTLGTPLQVANRYRMQHGKNPFTGLPLTDQKSIVADYYRTSASSRPVGSSGRRFFKYATLTLLTFFALFVASVFLIPILLFKFIAVDNFEKDFTFSFTDHKPQMERMQGKLSASPLNNLTFTMSNGAVQVTTDPQSSEITYECEVESDNAINEAQAAKVENGNASLILLNVENADCDLTVPLALPISINLTNGKISLTDIEQNVEANLTNGEIEFESSGRANIVMSATAQAGSVDGLKKFQVKQSNKKGPQYSAILSVGTGRIDIE